MEEVQSILQSGKDSIIQQALRIVGKDMDIDKFDATVFSNNKEINVRLKAPVRYVPYNSKAYYDISVLLLEKLVSYHAISNPKDFAKDTGIKFYTPTEEDLKNIRFVAASILDSHGIDIYNLPDKMTMTIYEQEDDFQIETISPHQESYYKVSKKWGVVHDLVHATLIPEPQEGTADFVEVLFEQETAKEPLDIDKMIKLKSMDTLQQLLLINFKNRFSKKDRLTVEEFDHHYNIIVSHPSNGGYTGGAEGYKVNKSTGEAEMEWHESPMPLPKKH